MFLVGGPTMVYQFADIMIWSSIDRSSPKKPEHFPEARDRDKGQDYGAVLER